VLGWVWEGSGSGFDRQTIYSAEWGMKNSGNKKADFLKYVNGIKEINRKITLIDHYIEGAH